MSSTKIEPYTQTTTNVITSFSVTCRSLELFSSATFTVDSFGENGNLVSRQVVPITNEQYLQWNNNDSFIISLIAEILGYTLVTPIPQSATQPVIQTPSEPSSGP
jgi:hypothetical protein